MSWKLDFDHTGFRRGQKRRAAKGGADRAATDAAAALLKL